MKVAVFQTSVDSAEGYLARVNRIMQKLESIDDCDLVVLPELWASGAFLYDESKRHAIRMTNELFEKLISISERKHFFLHAGSFAVLEDDNKITNKSILISPSKGIMKTYSKMHLFGFDTGERRVFSQGDSIESETIGEFKLGLAICYDLRFPELFRELAKAGSNLVSIPASWPLERVSHWKSLLVARAIENQSYVIGCNAVGTQNSIELGGNSMVVDPYGNIICALGKEEEIKFCEIQIDVVSHLRETFPVLFDRII